MTNGNESINAILDSEGNGSFKGLTKREYFAAMAMQGAIANTGVAKQANGEPQTYSSLSVIAVKAADALIIELNKQ